jgi:hypothetical protein
MTGVYTFAQSKLLLLNLLLLVTKRNDQHEPQSLEPSFTQCKRARLGETRIPIPERPHRGRRLAVAADGAVSRLDLGRESS